MANEGVVYSVVDGLGQIKVKSLLVPWVQC